MRPLEQTFQVCDTCHRLKTLAEFTEDQRRNEINKCIQCSVKKCNKCGELKGPHEFRVYETRSKVCIPCRNAYQNDYYRKQRLKKKGSKK